MCRDMLFSKSGHAPSQKIRLIPSGSWIVGSRRLEVEGIQKARMIARNTHTHTYPQSHKESMTSCQQSFYHPLLALANDKCILATTNQLLKKVL